MISKIKEYLINFFTSRTVFLFFVFCIMGGLMIHRVFVLQIVEGEEKQEEFELKIKKERTISSTRGNIYDCNGVLLAYNELANSVTIEDVYESGSTKNEQLNQTLRNVLSILHENGDKLSCDFNIFIDENGEFAFDVTGTKQQRFLADIYGQAKISDMSEKEKSSTADDVIEYLGGTSRYGVGERIDPEDSKSEFIVGKGFTKQELLEIITIRYAMSANSFQKYIGTTIASDVSEETVAIVKENSEVLLGVDIAADTIRKYVNGPYFSHIIGYTGKISTEELAALNSEDGMDGIEHSSENKTYELNDIVGKAGIEKHMEEYLQGIKGKETIFVDKMGKEIENMDRVEPIAGNDVYLTIDARLQADIYNILEQFVAGILVQKMRNIMNYDSSNVSTTNLITPIDDVYSALFANNVIDLDKLEKAREGQVQYDVYQEYLEKQSEVLTRLEDEMRQKDTAYNQLPKEYQIYESYIVNTLLSGSNVLTGIDTSDETYLNWAREEVIGIRTWLNYAISQNWIDVTKLELVGQYADSEEVYNSLVDYILEELDNKAFAKKIYKYMISQERISGKQICMLLIEQDKINPTEEEIKQLKNGTVSAYHFMVELIRTLQITPAQLALDPYSASCVLTDANTGEVKALVSYPSYDNNRLANGIDAKYYARVASGEDLSKPMWNYATQMKTAPGSTFKMVSATTALMENITDTSSLIDCPGLFTRFSDRSFKCWVYSYAARQHGKLNVSDALRHSCNIYFYEVGYQLGLEGEKYSSDLANEKIRKYADMYGLTEKSGIEIEESEPQVSTDLSIHTAIGQGNNNFTTVGLARYVTTVANSGTCYDLTLLDKVKDRTGYEIKDYSADVRNYVEMPESYWKAIHTGMKGVVESKSYFQDLNVTAAGKTGTAQEDLSRPNHALFVGYAPYENPEIALAVRIANGYSSDYAAQIGKQVLAAYYNTEEEENDESEALAPEAVEGGGD